MSIVSGDDSLIVQLVREANQAKQNIEYMKKLQKKFDSMEQDKEMYARECKLLQTALNILKQDNKIIQKCLELQTLTIKNMLGENKALEQRLSEYLEDDMDLKTIEGNKRIMYEVKPSDEALYGNYHIICNDGEVGRFIPSEIVCTCDDENHAYFICEVLNGFEKGKRLLTRLMEV